jgi:hypothetical protein
MAVLVRAFETEGESDGYKSRAELSELTGLSTYMLDKRLDALLKSGKAVTAKAYRRGPAGLLQKVYVYRLIAPRGSSGGG